MARSLSRASQLYPVNTYGPFPIDSFTQANTSALRWTLSVENWPANPLTTLARVTTKWSNGAGSITVINGSPRNPDGTLATEISGTISPLLVADANGNPVRAPMNGATILVEVLVPLRTAVTLEAMA